MEGQSITTSELYAELLALVEADDTPEGEGWTTASQIAKDAGLPYDVIYARLNRLYDRVLIEKAESRTGHVYWRMKA